MSSTPHSHKWEVITYEREEKNVMTEEPSLELHVYMICKGCNKYKTEKFDKL